DPTGGNRTPTKRRLPEPHVLLPRSADCRPGGGSGADRLEPVQRSGPVVSFETGAGRVDDSRHPVHGYFFIHGVRTRLDRPRMARGIEHLCGLPDGWLLGSPAVARNAVVPFAHSC